MPAKTKTKAKPRKAARKPAPPIKAPPIVSLRGTEEYREWLHGLAARLGYRQVTVMIEAVLAEESVRAKFPAPPLRTVLRPNRAE